MYKANLKAIIKDLKERLDYNVKRGMLYANRGGSPYFSVLADQDDEGPLITKKISLSDLSSVASSSDEEAIDFKLS